MNGSWSTARGRWLALNYAGILLFLGGAVLWPWLSAGSPSASAPAALKSAVAEVIAQQRRLLGQEGRYAAFGFEEAELAGALPEAPKAWSRVSGYRIAAMPLGEGGLRLQIVPDPAALRAGQVAPQTFFVELTETGEIAGRGWSSLAGGGSP